MLISEQSMALDTGCDVYKATLALLWVGFVLSTLIFVYTVYTAFRSKKNTVSLASAIHVWGGAADREAGTTWGRSFRQIGRKDTADEPRMTNTSRRSDETFVQPTTTTHGSRKAVPAIGASATAV